MFKNNLSAFCLLFLTFGSKAQVNLVPNHSFENHTQCPVNADNISDVTNWSKPTTGTPDYYNACFDSSMLWSNVMDIPLNMIGYQSAIGNGLGYAGIVVVQPGTQTYREYVQAQLNAVLSAGQKYYVSMYVSLADSSRYATDDFGIYFSSNPINLSSFDAFGYIPQIQNTQGVFLDDMINWIKISGSFIATGNEQYITIGNFKDDISTDTIRVISQSWIENLAYYYIDEICISTDSLTCNSTVGVKKIDSYDINIFFNSSRKEIIIKEVGSYTLQVSDLYGNTLSSNKLTGDQSLDVSLFNEGYYIVNLNSEKGIRSKKILIH